MVEIPLWYHWERQTAVGRRFQRFAKNSTKSGLSSAFAGQSIQRRKQELLSKTVVVQSHRGFKSHTSAETAGQIAYLR